MKEFICGDCTLAEYAELENLPDKAWKFSKVECSGCNRIEKIPVVKKNFR